MSPPKTKIKTTLGKLEKALKGVTKPKPAPPDPSEEGSIVGQSIATTQIPDGFVLPSWDELVAEKCKRSFKFFVQCAWSVVEPGSPLIWGWHMDAICDHLQACFENRIRNLIISVPPRHSKSSLVAVFFTAWVWLNQPGRRFIFCSYAAKLSVRDSRKCRGLIESPWFVKLFGGIFELAKDSNTILRFDNDKGGMRYATSVDGTITGEGGSYVIADDLNNLQEIFSEKKRENVHEGWKTLSSRVNPPQDEAHFIIIAQRGHDDDLIGHVKAKDAKMPEPTFTVLDLPAEFEVEFRCKTYLGRDKNGNAIDWQDPRTFEGELLWPQGCPKSYLDEQKITLGPYRYAAQYQQKPVPAEGGVFDIKDFRFYNPAELPPFAKWDDCCISVDMNFGAKDQSSASWVVMQAWCRVAAKFYLIDQDRGQWKYTKARQALINFCARYHFIWAIYVENKANGPAIIDDLEETEGIPGIIPVEPDGDKVARAHSIGPIVEAHNVLLPDPDLNHEISQRIMPSVLLEIATFPMGATDDCIDTMSQGVRKMRMAYIPLGMGVGEGEMPLDEQDSGRRTLERNAEIDAQLRAQAISKDINERLSDGKKVKAGMETHYHQHQGPTIATGEVSGDDGSIGGMPGVRRVFGGGSGMGAAFNNHQQVYQIFQAVQEKHGVTQGEVQKGAAGDSGYGLKSFWGNALKM
jgi:predicted phage terminase large subunit-like protein